MIFQGRRVRCHPPHDLPARHMPGVNLGSLLAAAIVPAVVAFSVEWPAKPRLEARTEGDPRSLPGQDDVWHALDSICSPPAPSFRACRVGTVARYLARAAAARQAARRPRAVR